VTSEDGSADPTATRLGRRRDTAGATPADVRDTRLGARRVTDHDDSPSPSDGHGTRPRVRRATAEPVTDSGGVVRFGPGVPQDHTATPGWVAGPTRSDRRRRWGAGLVTLLIAAGAVVYVLLRGGDPLAVTAVHVDAAVPPGVCDTVVDVVGTLDTNGRPGSVRYQWVRSDGETMPPQIQSVAAGATSTQVHLAWSVTGRGRLAARATLRVLDPAPAESTGSFTYSCP
jgi:hypothetical protein